MTQTKYVAGSGGGGGGKGGGGSHTPTEADDTLQSVQFASVLDVISEGEIQGLENGNKSIFLEDTPIENADGSNNFQMARRAAAEFLRRYRLRNTDPRRQRGTA